MIDELTFHHIGCLTMNIEESIKLYCQTLGFKVPIKIYTIIDQQVKVCFIEIGIGSNIEFVEPIGENKTLKKIAKSKNPYYHIGYKVMDISKTINQLTAAGFYLVNRFYSEAFENKECAFLYTSEMQLIELIEI
jgi:catechol 2,3-dioxygenase-like lactoylglutathione lyase family enzyme